MPSFNFKHDICGFKTRANKVYASKKKVFEIVYRYKMLKHNLAAICALSCRESFDKSYSQIMETKRVMGQSHIT